ncbi:MAG TPA: MBL fold metallo-hydrolase [Candidatus Lokiarchaeia archaeon]|nr:MBL fold metallo-hydrolase [Candidatus Lokiarchaeia archaeon]
MVKLETLGACREVGRSAFKLMGDNDEDQVILDYGISMKENIRDNFPGEVEPKNIKAVVCSHAHVDHSGMLPYLYISARPNCYMTSTTRMFVKYLLDDMLNLSGQTLPFEEVELHNLMKTIQAVKDFSKPIPVPGTKDCSLMFHDAGHIPGSVMAVVMMDGKRVLYTGDLNTIDTRLQWAAKAGKIPPLDAVITESTYASVVHPPRLETEQRFIEAIKETLDRGGQVLIPAFGVARSQEILCVLQTYGLQNKKIVLDGMARDISDDLLKHSGDLRMAYSLNRVSMVKTTKTRADRQKALETGDIIIAPSGMLKGGTARYYAENLIGDERNSVFLVSYQIKGTPGQLLLDDHRFFEEERDRNGRGSGKNARTTSPAEIPVKARVERFEFSSHSDGPALLHFLKELKFNPDNPDPKIFCVHGDADNCDYLATSINEQIEGVSGIAPKMNESFAI